MGGIVDYDQDDEGGGGDSGEAATAGGVNEISCRVMVFGVIRWSGWERIATSAI